jgi:hypothetical protein
LTLVLGTLNAQVRIGIRAGVSTSDLNSESVSITDQNGLEDLRLAIKDARYGVHGGLVLQAQIKKFVIQPEILLNSNRIDYELQDVNDTMSVNVFQEKYQYLDIPLLFGFSFKPLRVQVGPVGHVFLSSVSELDDFEGYRQDFESLTFGWQGSLGLDIWKFMIDLRYEGNFNQYGEHFNFFGQEYNFSQNPSRWLLSVGFRLGKN